MWTALWIVPLLFWLETSVRPIAEPDLFFYFALIENYLRHGHWAQLDPFLFTLPDDPLMSLHQWLGYWFYYAPYRLIGWAGPILLKTLVVGAIFALPLIPFWRNRERIPFYFPALWTLALFVAHHRFRERVSLFGDLSVVLLVSGLLWARGSRWFWCTLPVLFLVWAQVHPSYPLGWVILVGSFIVRATRTWARGELISLALCIVAPLANPLGLDGVLYPFVFTRDIEPYLRQYVAEWLPLTDSRLFPFRFLYIPLISFIPYLAWRLWRERRKLDWLPWFIFAVAVGLCMKSVRFGMLAQGLFLLLITHVDRERDSTVRNVPRLAAVAAFCLLILAIKVEWSPQIAPTPEARFRIDETYFPRAAVDDLERARPRMHVFNSFGFGGYLAWRWQGDPKIFFHGFSTNFKFYEENYNQPQESPAELDAVIRRFDIGLFILSKLGNDDNFIHLLETHEGWQKIREDQASVVFVKRDPRVFGEP